MEKEAFDSFKETLQSLSERQKADFCTLLMPIQARCAAGIAWTYQSNEWNFPHHESKPFLSISELSRIYSIERNPIQWSVLFRKVSTACDSNVNFTSSCHESQLDGRNIWVKKHVGIRNLTNLHKNAFSTVLFSKTFIVLTKSCVASVLEISKSKQYIIIIVLNWWSLPQSRNQSSLSEFAQSRLDVPTALLWYLWKWLINIIKALEENRNKNIIRKRANAIHQSAT